MQIFFRGINVARTHTHMVVNSQRFLGTSMQASVLCTAEFLLYARCTHVLGLIVRSDKLTRVCFALKYSFCWWDCCYGWAAFRTLCQLLNIGFSFHSSVKWYEATDVMSFYCFEWITVNECDKPLNSWKKRMRLLVDTTGDCRNELEGLESM